ncbi:lF-82 [Cronobacter sakazakii]|uniref:lF-82 n=2 Tax=Cronobacter sakazakii TaxID=28141 RepID=UPI000CFDD07C|nr:lF-82 [Cronobacter sakazakii]
MSKDSDYVIIYRGEIHHRITPGRWVLIQRAREYGGGWWLGKAYDDVFMLEFEKPSSMAVATEYIMSHGRMQTFPPWDDEFELKP